MLATLSFGLGLVLPHLQPTPAATRLTAHDRMPPPVAMLTREAAAPRRLPRICLTSELIEQASLFCELRRQVTINDLGYKGKYKGWRPATHHRTRSGRFCSPSASMVSPNTAPAWEDDPPADEDSHHGDPPGSLDHAAKSGKEIQKKQHNTLPTIQPPSGPFKVRDSLSIIATDEIPPGPFRDKREIEMYRHVTFR